MLLLSIALADIVIEPPPPQPPTNVCQEEGAPCAAPDGTPGVCKDKACVAADEVTEPPKTPPPKADVPKTVPAKEQTKSTGGSCSTLGTPALAGGMVVGALGLLLVGRRKNL
jgi:hypothetical protein